ncbi:hypothetical protein [Vallitalea okinawensis]|uniref:hypothetical protein n=1 Tax=Vallitalea okinawensis TaxID=2078660 RepID=UPI000CFDB275|nr:hypothetical protein [Vallitalea okinawensis]
MQNSRVIMVDGSHSGWYEKAIFILTEQGQQKDVSNNMVDEAERIVEAYLKKQLRNETNNRDYKVKQKDYVTTTKRRSMKPESSIRWMSVFAIISMILCAISLVSFIL